MITVNNECYVSLEIAKLLKQLGFDWKVTSYYQHGVFYPYLIDRYQIIVINNNSSPDYMEQYAAPTLETAQTWFQNVHHLHITIFSSSQESWMFRITKPHQKLEDGIYGEDFYSYEKAKEASIEKACEIILENKSTKIMTAKELAEILLQNPDAKIVVNKIEFYGDELPSMDEKEVLLAKDEVCYNGAEYVIGASAIV